MGDRTALQVIVHDAHHDEIDAIFEALEEYFDHSNAAHYGGHDAAGGIELGDVMVAVEVSCGSSDSLAARLAAEAPRSCFTVWENPKYEWLGSLRLIHRDLGTFGAECTADGVALFTEDQIRKFVDENLTGDALSRAVGSLWREAFEAIDRTNAGRTIHRRAESVGGEEEGGGPSMGIWIAASHDEDGVVGSVHPTREAAVRELYEAARHSPLFDELMGQVVDIKTTNPTLEQIEAYLDALPQYAWGVNEAPGVLRCDNTDTKKKEAL